MSKIIQFIKEMQVEVRKVVWPSREEIVFNAKAVFIVLFLFAIFFGLVDMVLIRLTAIVF